MGGWGLRLRNPIKTHVNLALLTLVDFFGSVRQRICVLYVYFYNNVLSCAGFKHTGLFFFFFLRQYFWVWKFKSIKQACECKHILISKLCLGLVRSGSEIKEKVTRTNTSGGVRSPLNWWLKTLCPRVNTDGRVCLEIRYCFKHCHRQSFPVWTNVATVQALTGTPHIFGCYRVLKKA